MYFMNVYSWFCFKWYIFGYCTCFSYTCTGCKGHLFSKQNMYLLYLTLSILLFFFSKMWKKLGTFFRFSYCESRAYRAAMYEFVSNLNETELAKKAYTKQQTHNSVVGLINHLFPSRVLHVYISIHKMI